MTSATTTTVDADAESVWAVLADGWLYGLWVVGASRIREVDDSWPAAESRIHHSVGSWPFVIDDTTHVVASERPHHLRLQARAWPSGEAWVDITVEDTEHGALVTMQEDASHGPALLIPSPVRRAALDWRNAESLRRLRFLVERRQKP